MPVASTAGTIATTASLTVLLMVTGAAVCGVLAVRAARQRYRRLRRRMLLVPLTVGPRMLGYVARTPAVSPTWWTTQVDRRRLWRSVAAAEHAVATAKAAGAPLADLPSLNRQLRRAASAVDSAMVAASRSRTPTSAAVARQARDVRASADRIHHAAVESLSSVADGHTSQLARSVEIETEALRAGLQSSLAAGSGRPA
jgi:ABC-type molybdate transport system permease subunit